MNPTLPGILAYDLHSDFNIGSEFPGRLRHTDHHLELDHLSR